MLQKSPMYAYIPAKDVNRARKFYEKTLGLKPKEEYAGGVVYEFGAGTEKLWHPTHWKPKARKGEIRWQQARRETTNTGKGIWR